jgi:aspartate kinase
MTNTTITDRGKTLVMKFGGTSVGSIKALQQVIAIVKAARRDWQRVVVVTSAFSGVTNNLLASAIASARGDLQPYESTLKELQNRHNQALDTFTPKSCMDNGPREKIDDLINQFSQLVLAISAIGESSPRALDAVASLGERLSVCVLTAALQSADIPVSAISATNLVQTDNRFQNAIPDMEITRRKTHQILNPLLLQGITPVITGFIGSAACGAVTTLGRGGSDYSAAILASLLPADEVWIWTDVDGVMTADPRVVPEARTIPFISYREVAELAYYGAKVLHPKSIRPIIEASIPLRVLNTFNPNSDGTLLTNEEHPTNGNTIKAVTAFRGMKLVTVEGRGMLGVPGVAARIFSAVATTGATVPLITEASSEQSLTFAVPAKIAPQVLESLNNELASEISNRNIDHVWATDEVVIITAVCPAMRTKLGVAGRVFSALGEAEVNVLAISHGSSDVSISLVVCVNDWKRTVTALHTLTSI